MDIHPPTGKVASIKEYLVHLSMVVLGILIALGLEGWREARHDAELVQHSLAAMRAEIVLNKKQVQVAYDNYEKSRPIVQKLRKQLEAAIQAKKAKQAHPEHDENTETLHIEVPSLSSGAWQAALATQAFARMSYQQAQLWSTVYAMQDQARLFHNEWIGFYGRLAPINVVSDAADLPLLQQQLELTRDILMRMAIMQAVWTGLLERYDQVLKMPDGEISAFPSPF